MAVQIRDVTITAGGTDSSVLNLLPGEVICGIQLPAAFKGTALAIHASMDAGASVVPLYDGFGNAVSFTVATLTARGYYLPTDVFYPLANVKFISNQAQAGNTITVKVAVREGV